MKLPPVHRRLSKGELRNVEVELVSLLFDDMNPANQKGAVVKSDSATYAPRGGSIKYKAVPSEGRLYVTLMEPDLVDAQGDTYTAAEIVKAADHFAVGGLVGRNDVNHNMHPVPEFQVVESYILKTADPEHYPDTALGAWVQVVKCLDLSSELWEKVVKGAFRGVSIYGRADDVPSRPAQELKALVEELRKALEPAAVDAVAAEPPADPDPDEVPADLPPAAPAAADQADTTLQTEIQELQKAMKKAISTALKGEPGPAEQDHTVRIDGREIVVKADHAEIYKGIATVDAGAPMNILTPNTTSLFIDEVIASQPGDTLSDITVVPLIKDEKIDAGVIADLVFTNSLDAAAAAQDISSADIACTTGILTAEFTLGRDVVEFYKDKYGEAAFGAYVEQHIARKTEKAIRKLLFQGDRNSATAALKALDGIIEKARDAAGGSKIVALDATTYPTIADRFEQALLAFSDDVLEDQANFAFYISHKDMVRLRADLATRLTVAGDRFLLEAGAVSFAGIPVKARLMPDSYIVAGLPKFIIIGYRTDAELKVEHHGADWKYHWYIRVRPGITYVDPFVKVFYAS